MTLVGAVLPLIVLLAACQLGDDPARSSSPPVAAVTTEASRLPRVAYLWAGPPPLPGPLMLDEFRSSLTSYGWEEGKNAVVEAVSVEHQVERYPQVIADLIASHPDVIVVGDSAAAPLVAEATTVIPVVLTLGGNPVAAGQACSVNRPCGNITGLSLSLYPLSPKRLEHLKAVAPSIRRVGFLRNAGIPETENELEAVQAVAPSFGVEIVPLQFYTTADFDGAFQEAIDREIDALLVMPDSISLLHRTAILGFASQFGLPDAYGVRNAARDGGLFSYGADRLYNFRRAAFYVDRILRGTKPTDLPIEQPSRFELVINLARANQLGLTFPASMMAADAAVR